MTDENQVWQLTEEVFSAISSEGEKGFPNEICGVLLGTGRDITEILAIENSREAEEQYHRFRIEPDDLFRAEKIARGKELDILGFYHSHPDSPARASDYDREYALPYYLYLILEVRGGKAKELAAFSLSLDRSTFNPAEYTVTTKKET